MNLELTEDQEFFRETTRRFLDSEAPLTSVRGSLWEPPTVLERDWWSKAAELGWTTLFVPEAHGGGSLSGHPVQDAVIVAEEMGRIAAPGPFLPVNVVVCRPGADGSDELQAELFPGPARGRDHRHLGVRRARRHVGRLGGVAHRDARRRRDRAHGEKAYVEAAGVADHFLVTGRTGDGLTQVIVPAGADGVTVTRGRSIDLVRRYGSIDFDGVRVPASAVVGEVGGAAAAVEHQLEIALALQCAETVGAADRVFEFTIEYAQDRYAFGRPIASFQALKHRIADMLVWLEFSKSISEPPQGGRRAGPRRPGAPRERGQGVRRRPVPRPHRRLRADQRWHRRHVGARHPHLLPAGRGRPRRVRLARRAQGAALVLLVGGHR